MLVAWVGAKKKGWLKKVGVFSKGEGGGGGEKVKKGEKGEVLPRTTGGDGVPESGHEAQDNERTFSDKLAPSYWPEAADLAEIVIVQFG